MIIIQNEKRKKKFSFFFFFERRMYPFIEQFLQLIFFVYHFWLSTAILWWWKGSGKESIKKKKKKKTAKKFWRQKNCLSIDGIFFYNKECWMMIPFWRNCSPILVFHCCSKNFGLIICSNQTEFGYGSVFYNCCFTQLFCYKEEII